MNARPAFAVGLLRAFCRAVDLPAETVVAASQIQRRLVRGRSLSQPGDRDRRRWRHRLVRASKRENCRQSFRRTPHASKRRRQSPTTLAFPRPDKLRFQVWSHKRRPSLVSLLVRFLLDVLVSDLFRSRQVLTLLAQTLPR